MIIFRELFFLAILFGTLIYGFMHKMEALIIVDTIVILIVIVAQTSAKKGE